MGSHRNRRLSKDYELKVPTSEAFIDLAAIRLMLKRLARGKTSQTPSKTSPRKSQLFVAAHDRSF